MSLIDDLREHPGVYIGLDRDPTSDGSSPAAARILVTPLPGRAGVALDYETFNPAHPDRLRGHKEHAVLARTHGGGAVLVTSHIHADSVTILQETEPGTFELGAGASAFPMKIVVSVPEPGRLRYVWWYGMPGDELVERDVAEVALAE